MRWLNAAGRGLRADLIPQRRRRVAGRESGMMRPASSVLQNTVALRDGDPFETSELLAFQSLNRDVVADMNRLWHRPPLANGN